MRKRNHEYDVKLDEALGITQTTIKFIKQTGEDTEAFDRQVKEINGRINSAKDEETRKDYLLYLISMRNLFSEAWKKSSARFLEYLKGL